MNVALKDLGRMSWSIVFLILAIALGAGLVMLPRQAVDAAERAERQLAARLDEINGRVNSASEEEQDIRARIARYRELIAHGVIGQEERLDWVEQIARIKAARRLLDLQYEIQPQAPIGNGALPGAAAAGPYQIMASTMTLRMQLLHEEDLLGFLADLRQAVHALLLVRECRIERVARTGAGGTPAHLQADCTIDWVTLREKT